MAEKNMPELEIVLPDGRPVSEFQETEEDLGTVLEFDASPEGALTTVVEIEISDEENPFYEHLAEEM